MFSILEEIIEYKQKVVKDSKNTLPLDNLKDKIELQNYQTAKLIPQQKLQLIAEIKYKSPSKGIIRPDFNHLEIAENYIQKNVAAISILTDQKYFGGDNRYLRDIRKITDLPLLRKEFIIDPYQVYETKYLGADLILLIVACLGNNLAEFLELALDLDLQPLIEVHDQTELDLTLSILQKNLHHNLSSVLIGINNRNLKSFEVDIQTCINLKAKIPKEYMLVAESGIKTIKELELLDKYQFGAVLIGEGLAKDPNLINWF